MKNWNIALSYVSLPQQLLQPPLCFHRSFLSSHPRNLVQYIKTRIDVADEISILSNFKDHWSFLKPVSLCKSDPSFLADCSEMSLFSRPGTSWSHQKQATTCHKLPQLFLEHPGAKSVAAMLAGAPHFCATIGAKGAPTAPTFLAVHSIKHLHTSRHLPSHFNKMPKTCVNMPKGRQR